MKIKVTHFCVESMPVVEIIFADTLPVFPKDAVNLLLNADAQSGNLYETLEYVNLSITKNGKILTAHDGSDHIIILFEEA